MSEQGSTILTKWRAEQEAARNAPQNNSMKLSEGIPGSELYDLLTGGGAFAGTGVPVTERTVMAVGAVYACLALIGGALASIPFHLYKRVGQDRERYDSDLWWLFNESPADNWTAASAWQYTAQCLGLRGVAYWRIIRVTPFTNAIDHFEIYHPDWVQPFRKNKRTFYNCTNEDGTVDTVDSADMLHFTGFGYDGKRPLTPLQAALRTAAGVALAADEYSAAFFRNGSRPDFALTTEKGLTKDQIEALRVTWGQRHQGVANAHLPAVLTGGLKVEQLTMTAEDAQLIQTRSYRDIDVARILGVPPHMIGITDKSTSWGAGIEQQSLGFVRYTMRRYMDPVAQEINRKIWPKSRLFFGEHLVDALIEGDIKTQGEYFAKALGGPGTQGWMVPNEVRRLKNLPAIQEDWANKLVKAGSSDNSNGNMQSNQETGNGSDETAGTQ